MKTTAALLALLILSTSLSIPTATLAQGELPGAGVTPDSFLYVFDRSFEGMQSFLTFDPLAKAELHAAFAGERLAELRIMVDRGRPEFVKGLTEDYEGTLGTVDGIAEAAKAAGADTTKVSEVVALATSIHLEVLEGVYDRAPDEAKPAILIASAASVKGQENSLDRLGEVLPERSVELYVRFAEERLSVAIGRAERGEVREDIVEEYGRKLAKAGEMTDRAEGLGRDTAGLLELVGTATSKHIEVLSAVEGRVPEQAKAAIRLAMAFSSEGRERALEALQKASPARAEGVRGLLPKELIEEARKAREEHRREVEKLKESLPRPPPPSPPSPELPAFDFGVAVLVPDMVVAQGGSVSSGVTSSLMAGVPQPITLALSGLPEGASASFSPPSGTPTFTSTLLVSTSPTTPPGTYHLRITATGGGVSHSVDVTLTVTPGGPPGGPP